MSANADATNSGVAPEALKTKLEEQLEATYVEIEDMSGTFDSIYDHKFGDFMVCCTRISQS